MLQYLTITEDDLSMKISILYGDYVHYLHGYKNRGKRFNHVFRQSSFSTEVNFYAWNTKLENV